MDGKRTIVGQLRKVKMNISKDFPVDRMIFFGSRASGKPHKWSDIDLIIVSSKFRSMDFIERGAKMYNYWNLNYPVDFVCFTPEEFKERAGRASIVREAIKTGIEIRDDTKDTAKRAA